MKHVEGSRKGCASVDWRAGKLTDRRGVMDTVARARGGVVHTSGITSQSPGGAGRAPVMPQVGPTWDRPRGRDSPRWGVGGLVCMCVTDLVAFMQRRWVPHRPAPTAVNVVLMRYGAGAVCVDPVPQQQF